MSEQRYPMTSTAWVEQVFNAPPARNLKGHAKYTQAFRTPSKNGGFVDTQGNTETAAALLLTYLANQGYVGRFKPQPFFTVKDEFGVEICPDFLVEVLLPKKTIFIIEVKTEAYLDDAARERLEENREKFEKFGLPYVVWTDKEHLGSIMAMNLDMWRLNGANVPLSEVDGFSKWLSELNETTIGDAVRAGFTLDVIEAAAWAGKAFMPLGEPARYDMLLTATPQDDLMESHFQLQVARKSWWSRFAGSHKPEIRR
ncbi:hypothetical protein [Herbaspirillum sp.]|uniref:hypothetical protein n=1 Tax=Herbaspirillum sp. TaxID=1890675 RepID=UPI0031D6ABFD